MNEPEVTLTPDLSSLGGLSIEPDQPSAVVVDPPLSPDTVEPAAAPVVADPAAPEPVAPEPVEPVAARPRSGMLEDLIAERARRKAAEEHVENLTRELSTRAAGPAPVVVPSREEAHREQARLVAIAEKWGFQTVDDAGTVIWDLDRARAADEELRSVARQAAQEAVQAEVAPIRHNTIKASANSNVAIAVAEAQKMGLSPEAVDVVRQEFVNLLATPNGAEYLSQKRGAETVWEKALGSVWTRGLYAPTAPAKAPAAPAPVVPSSAPALPAPPASVRHHQTGGIVLTPAEAAVYRGAGLDPNASAAPTRDSRGAITLE